MLASFYFGLKVTGLSAAAIPEWGVHSTKRFRLRV